MFLLALLLLAVYVVLFVKEYVGILGLLPDRVEGLANLLDIAVIVLKPHSRGLVLDEGVVMAISGAIAFVDNNGVKIVNVVEFFGDLFATHLFGIEVDVFCVNLNFFIEVNRIF